VRHPAYPETGWRRPGERPDEITARFPHSADDPRRPGMQPRALLGAIIRQLAVRYLC
jgi:hypothetical protein